MTNKLEGRAYYAARRVGLRAVKSRDRSIHIDNLGGFMLADPLTNTVVSGVRYDMTPDDIIKWCAGLKAVPYGEGSDVLVAPHNARVHPSQRSQK